LSRAGGGGHIDGVVLACVLSLLCDTAAAAALAALLVSMVVLYEERVCLAGSLIWLLF
jgi:hypothetical protein